MMSLSQGKFYIERNVALTVSAKFPAPVRLADVV